MAPKLPKLLAALYSLAGTASAGPNDGTLYKKDLDDHYKEITDTIKYLGGDLNLSKYHTIQKIDNLITNPSAWTLPLCIYAICGSDAATMKSSKDYNYFKSFISHLEIDQQPIIYFERKDSSSGERVIQDEEDITLTSSTSASIDAPVDIRTSISLGSSIDAYAEGSSTSLDEDRLKVEEAKKVLLTMDPLPNMTVTAPNTVDTAFHHRYFRQQFDVAVLDPAVDKHRGISDLPDHYQSLVTGWVLRNLKGEYQQLWSVALDQLDFITPFLQEITVAKMCAPKGSQDFVDFSCLMGELFGMARVFLTNKTTDLSSEHVPVSKVYSLLLTVAESNKKIQNTLAKPGSEAPQDHLILQKLGILTSEVHALKMACSNAAGQAKTTQVQITPGVSMVGALPSTSNAPSAPGAPSFLSSASGPANPPILRVPPPQGPIMPQMMSQVGANQIPSSQGFLSMPVMPPVLFGQTSGPTFNLPPQGALNFGSGVEEAD